MKKQALLGGLVAATMVAGAIGSTTFDSQASSHREAPAIGADPLADATDLYAFVAEDTPTHVTFVANYVPFGLPAAGPNFYRFADDVLYEINIDNNGDAKDDISYQFRFRNDINAANAFGGNTFLYNTGQVTTKGDADQNIRQFFSVARLDGKGNGFRNGTQIANNLEVAPARTGPKSNPNYGALAAQFNHSVGSGIKVFAGPRDDPFFVDLGGTFDLLNLGGAEDYVKGLNVMSIVIQVPKNQLTANGQTPTLTTDPNAVIGVRTTAYRQSRTVLRGLPQLGASASGGWVQVSRLDLPLVNEVVVPLKDKDRFNASKPENDGQFLTYVQNSHLAALLNLVLGVNVPANPRNDLVDVLLKGVPGLNRPAGVVASSQLRLNIAVPPATMPKRLGVLEGDLAGFPNGRRLTDDVTDIEIAVIAGCLQGGAFAPNCALGDGVNTNDRPFLSTFPYLALPHDYEGTNP